MIRQAKISDINAIVKLELKVLKETLGAIFFDNELNINIFSKYYVYEINKEIIAYIGTRVYDDSLEIMNFVVNTNYQNQGIGSKLLETVVSNHLQKGIISLEVRKSNKQALSFYKKHGFILDHVKKAYYGSEDAYYLIKEIL